MNCFVCAQSGVEQVAVGLCHCCSAGLCNEHTLERSRPVIAIAPLNREVALPLKTRELLCGVCKQALEQPRRVA
jgi:hypothetical protein